MSLPLDAASGSPAVAAFESLSQHHTLEIVDQSGHTVRTHHRFRIRALHQERFFRRVYSWSGSGIEKEPIITSGADRLGHQHKLHGPVIRNGEDRLFFVDLGADIQAGECVDIAIEHTFIDVDRTLKPFLSYTPKRHGEFVEITLIRPTQMNSSVTAMSFRTGSDHPATVETLDAEPIQRGTARYHKFTYTVDTCERGFYYQVKW